MRNMRQFGEGEVVRPRDRTQGSVGLENVEDLLDDLQQALDGILGYAQPHS